MDVHEHPPMLQNSLLLLAFVSAIIFGHP
jgi:hypothetical protein